SRPTLDRSQSPAPSGDRIAPSKRHVGEAQRDVGMSRLEPFRLEKSHLRVLSLSGRKRLLPRDRGFEKVRRRRLDLAVDLDVAAKRSAVRLHLDEEVVGAAAHERPDEIVVLLDGATAFCDENLLAVEPSLHPIRGREADANPTRALRDELAVAVPDGGAFDLELVAKIESRPFDLFPTTDPSIAGEGCKRIETRHRSLGRVSVRKTAPVPFPFERSEDPPALERDRLGSFATPR